MSIFSYNDIIWNLAQYLNFRDLTSARIAIPRLNYSILALETQDAYWKGRLSQFLKATVPIRVKTNKWKEMYKLLEKDYWRGMAALIPELIDLVVEIGIDVAKLLQASAKYNNLDTMQNIMANYMGQIKPSSVVGWDKSTDIRRELLLDALSNEGFDVAVNLLNDNTINHSPKLYKRNAAKSPLLENYLLIVKKWPSEIEEQLTDAIDADNVNLLGSLLTLYNIQPGSNLENIIVNRGKRNILQVACAHLSDQQYHSALELRKLQIRYNRETDFSGFWTDPRFPPASLDYMFNPLIYLNKKLSVSDLDAMYQDSNFSWDIIPVQYWEVLTTECIIKILKQEKNHPSLDQIGDLRGFLFQVMSYFAIRDGMFYLIIKDYPNLINNSRLLINLLAIKDFDFVTKLVSAYRLPKDAETMFILEKTIENNILPQLRREVELFKRILS